MSQCILRRKYRKQTTPFIFYDRLKGDAPYLPRLHSQSNRVIYQTDIILSPCKTKISREYNVLEINDIRKNNRNIEYLCKKSVQDRQLLLKPLFEKETKMYSAELNDKIHCTFTNEGQSTINHVCLNPIIKSSQF